MICDVPRSGDVIEFVYYVNGGNYINFGYVSLEIKIKTNKNVGYTYKTSQIHTQQHKLMTLVNLNINTITAVLQNGIDGVIMRSCTISQWKSTAS